MQAATANWEKKRKTNARINNTVNVINQECAVISELCSRHMDDTVTRITLKMKMKAHTTQKYL